MHLWLCVLFNISEGITDESLMDWENFGGLLEKFSAKLKFESEFTEGIIEGLIKNNII
jgi:hypothetical protein